MNPFYVVQTTLIPFVRGRSSVRNAEFEAIEDGFDLVASYSGEGLGTFAGDTTGSSNAYAVTMPDTRTANTDGAEVVFIANHTNTGAATLNVDTIGAVDLVGPSGSALEAGDIASGIIYAARYDQSNSRFQLVSPSGSVPDHTHEVADITDAGALAALDTVDTAQIDDDAVTSAKIADGAVGTAALADEAVTLAKMQHISTNRLLGRQSASTGDVEQIVFEDAGSWTPFLADPSKAAAGTKGETYAEQHGRYTRIGSLVKFQGYLEMSDLGTLGGQAFIGGLPFTSNANPPYGVVSFGLGTGLFVSDGDPLKGYVSTSDTFITVTRWDGVSGTSSITVGEITDDGGIAFSGEYFV